MGHGFLVCEIADRGFGVLALGRTEMRGDGEWGRGRESVSDHVR